MKDKREIKGNGVVSEESFDPIEAYFNLRPSRKNHCQSNDNSDVAANDLRQKIASTADDFFTVMDSLLQYAQQGLAVSHNSVDSNLQGYYQGLTEILKDTPKKHANYEMVLDFKDKENKNQQFVIPISELGQVFKVQDYLSAAVAAPRIICSSILQQLVNAWEGFLGNCFSLKMACEKNLINGKLSIPYESVRNIHDIADLHQYAIEQSVSEVLRQTTREQLTSLKTYFGVDALSWLKDVRILEEVVYRRHMLVHCDGRAAGVYCKQVVKLGFDAPSVGADISPSIDYLFKAWDEIFSTGAIVAHSIAYQAIKDNSGKDEENLYGGQADSALLSRSYNALKKGRYEAVKRIGEYAKQRKLHDEWIQKALLVNLALAYKHLANNQKDFQSIVRTLDEHSCPAEFAAPIACLRGDFDGAFKIVKRGCKQRDGQKARNVLKELMEWPIYAELRQTSKCVEFLESTDMKARIDEYKTIDPKIDFGCKNRNPTNALRNLYALCQERQRGSNKSVER